MPFMKQKINKINILHKIKRLFLYSFVGILPSSSKCIEELAAFWNLLYLFLLSHEQVTPSMFSTWKDHILSVQSIRCEKISELQAKNIDDGPLICSMDILLKIGKHTGKHVDTKACQLISNHLLFFAHAINYEFKQWPSTNTVRPTHPLQKSIKSSTKLEMAI